MEVEWNDVPEHFRRQIDQGLGQDQHTADSSAPDEGNPAVLGQDCGNQVEEERGQNPPSPRPIPVEQRRQPERLTLFLS